MALIDGSEIFYLPDGPDGFGYTQAGFYVPIDGYDYAAGYSDGFAAASVVPEAATPPTPIEAPYVPGDAAYVDHVALGLGRVCEIFRGAVT